MSEIVSKWWLLAGSRLQQRRDGTFWRRALASSIPSETKGFEAALLLVICCRRSHSHIAAGRPDQLVICRCEHTEKSASHLNAQANALRGLQQSAIFTYLPCRDTPGRHDHRRHHHLLLCTWVQAVGRQEGRGLACQGCRETQRSWKTPRAGESRKAYSSTLRRKLHVLHECRLCR